MAAAPPMVSGWLTPKTSSRLPSFSSSKAVTWMVSSPVLVPVREEEELVGFPGGDLCGLGHDARVSDL